MYIYKFIIDADHEENAFNSAFSGNKLKTPLHFINY